jgi:2'-phosphotransferase
MSSAGRRGGRNPKDLPRDQQVSRKVSWLLRHGAGQEGLTLGKGGYVNVGDAVSFVYVF